MGTRKKHRKTMGKPWKNNRKKWVYIGLSPLTLAVTTIQTTNEKTQARWTQNAIEKLGWHILSVYQPTKKLGFSQHEPNSS